VISNSGTFCGPVLMRRLPAQTSPIVPMTRIANVAQRQAMSWSGCGRDGDGLAFPR
jgi:hypothetical protein